MILWSGVIKTCTANTPAAKVREYLKKYKIPCITVLDNSEQFVNMIEERSISKYLNGKIMELNKTLESLG